MAEDEAAVVAQESDAAIKLLLSNREAGCLIGKGGSSIVALQTKSGCRVRVSKADDFFPATQDRVVLITGSFSAVSEGISNILESIFLGFPEPSDEGSDPAKKLPAAMAESKMITLAIPNAAAGLIIGKGGANIKLISSKAGAHIQLAGKDRQIHGLDERLMHITGSFESVTAAARIILEKLGEDAANRYEHMSTSYRHLTAFAQRPFAMLPQMPPPHSRGMQPMMHFPGPPQLPPPLPLDRRGPPRGMPTFGGPGGPPRIGGGPGADVEPSTLTMNLPDGCIPAVVGRGGSIIQSIQAHTGARVQLSARGDYVAGTRDHRLVTITGPTYQQAHAALMMISERAGIPYNGRMGPQ
jgi:RNA-binding protein Nova